jgi:hypothetical protein
LNKTDQDHDNGQEKEEVNESPERLGTHHPQDPQNQQNNRNRFQHWDLPWLKERFDTKTLIPVTSAAEV